MNSSLNLKTGWDHGDVRHLGVGNGKRLDTSAHSNSADVGDGGASVDVWTLAGTAAAPSVGNLFEGDLSFGSAEALGPGVSTFTTNAPADGSYSLTPTAVGSTGNASAASAALIPVTSDTPAQSSSLTVGPAQSVTVAAGATVEISGAGCTSGDVCRHDRHAQA